MRKNNKITITILLAIVFAIAAGVCVFSLLSPRFTTYYVFNSTYKAGTPLTSEMLTPIEAPASIVVAGAETDGTTRLVTTQNLRSILTSGDALKMDVSEGMPLMQSMLSVTGGSTIEMIMSPSKIAMTVSVTDITGVTDELSSGSSVNVYIMSEGTSYLLFENMRLLAVNRNESGALVSATLELTNEQAKALLNAQVTGSVYFGLVNSGGYVYELTGNKNNTSEDGENTGIGTAPVEETTEEPVVEIDIPTDLSFSVDSEPIDTNSSFTVNDDVNIEDDLSDDVNDFDNIDEQTEIDTQSNNIQEVDIVG